MPFDVTLMSVKPYYEKEYGYLFSFSGMIMKLCRLTDHKNISPQNTVRLYTCGRKLLNEKKTCS